MSPVDLTLQRYRQIWFDFDGTLVNSLFLAAEFFNARAAARGYKSIDDVDSVRGMHLQQFLAAHRVPRHHLPRLFVDFLSYQRSAINRLCLVQGIDEVLRRLSEEGRELWVVSSNRPDNVRGLLKQQGCSVFRNVLGISRLSGKGAAIKRALAEQGSPQRNLLYVGDETRDIEAARTAGIDVAAVTWGFQSADVLRRAGPTYLVEKPDDLLEICLR